MFPLKRTRRKKKALERFKDTGKFIYAYGDFYTQKDYYLASIADSIFINPVGIMEFKGLSAEVLYFKDLQDKTGVKMEVVRHGKYKSAVEPFLQNEMSDENRTQIYELISSIWKSVVGDISESRGLEVEEVDKIADDLGARTPELAVSNKLVDDILYYDQYETRLKNATGRTSDEKMNYISLKDYTQLASGKSRAGQRIGSQLFSPRAICFTERETKKFWVRELLSRL